MMSIKKRIININSKYQRINIKNRTYFSFIDMNDITNFNPNLLKIDKKSYKTTYIFYIGCITMKDSDYVKVCQVNKHFEEKKWI